MHVDIHVCIDINVTLCGNSPPLPYFVCVFVWVCLHAYVNGMYACMHVCIRIYVDIFIHICLYMYIYIYIYIHIKYIYI